MTKSRMEAFSDGVIAILITIMVLELKAPLGAGWEALRPLWAIFLSYVLSFIFLGIYWNNHHHLLQAVHRVNGRVLWANMHLLFWLSLVPFVTGWMGENHFAALPVAAYGVVLFCSACAYTILTLTLLSAEGGESTLAHALGKDAKGKISIALYAIAIPFSIVESHISLLLYVVVAALWLVPDRRMERAVDETKN